MAMSDDALIRLARLKKLGYSPAELALELGTTAQYWRDLLAGKKSFGEKIARRVEEKLGLQRYYLDLRDDDAPPPKRAPKMSDLAFALAAGFEQLPADTMLRADVYSDCMKTIKAALTASKQPSPSPRLRTPAAKQS